MATVKKAFHANKRDHSYRVRWRNADGSYGSKTVRTKAEANELAVEVEKAKRSGPTPYGAGSKIRLGDWIATVHADRVKRGKLRPKTATGQGHLLRLWLNPDLTHLRQQAAAPNLTEKQRQRRTEKVEAVASLPRLWDRKLNDISHRQVQQYVDALVEHLAPWSISQIVGILKVALKQARKEGLMVHNPTEGLELPEIEQRDEPGLTPDEAREVIAAMPERYRALVRLGAAASLRMGEATGLQIDYLGHLMDPKTGSYRLTGTLRVEEQLLEIDGSVRDSDGSLRFGPPKTKSSRRTITLDPITTAMLEAHVNKYKPGENGLVFTGPRGGPINPSNFRSRVWNPTVEKIAGRRVRFHDFRVSSVGWLREAGLDLRTIADRLGHSDISVTANVYSRFSGDLDQAAAKVIGERLGVNTVSTEARIDAKPQVRAT